MMRITSRTVLLAGLFLASGALAQQRAEPMPPNFAVQPVQQDAVWAIEWWRPRHDEKIEQARDAEIDLLMLGDSITQGWEGPGAAIWDLYYADRNAFNLGFGGDRTEHVLWRLRHGAVDDMHPQLVVLMIGTNNTGHRMDPAAHTAEGVALIVDELRDRLPSAKVLLLAIFPRNVSPYNDMRERNDEINQRIESLADGNAIHFLDVNEVFLDANGTLRAELMPDLLHPNTAGYEAWASAMEPMLEMLMSQ